MSCFSCVSAHSGTCPGTCPAPVHSRIAPWLSLCPHLPQGVLFMRCTLSQLGSHAAVENYSPLWAASLRAMSRLSHLVDYDVSLDHWLGVLEALSRSRTRLLIVTGFASTVQYQIPRLRLVHPNYDLSGLQIRVLAAPMTFPRLATSEWPLEVDPKDENFGARLDRLRASSEWDPSRNDVAFLGCGALGLPLARHAKERGISAVYLGGLVQLLFGISGKRCEWLPTLETPSLPRHSLRPRYCIDSRPRGTDVESLIPDGKGGFKPTGGLSSVVFTGRVRVNTDWIAPLDSETPVDYKLMEQGAYW